MDRNERIDHLLAEQRGLITRKQALSRGLSRQTIETRLRTGAWIRIQRGLFAVRGTPMDFPQRTRAALLAAGDAFAASHETAAYLLGLVKRPPSRIEITTSLTRHHETPGVTVHRSGKWHEYDLTERDAIPVTSAARTIVDLSSRLEDSRLEAMVDEAFRRHQANPALLRRAVERLGRAPGRSPARMHRLLAFRIPGYEPGDSALETRVLRALVDAGLPAPLRNHPVASGGRTYHVDLAYPEAMLAIEVDGFSTHSERRAFEIDRARANDLVIDGWRVIRFTSKMSDDIVVGTVQRAMRPPEAFDRVRPA